MCVPKEFLLSNQYSIALSIPRSLLNELQHISNKFVWDKKRQRVSIAGSLVKEDGGWRNSNASHLSTLSSCLAGDFNAVVESFTRIYMGI